MVIGLGAIVARLAARWKLLTARARNLQGISRARGTADSLNKAWQAN